MELEVRQCESRGIIRDDVVNQGFRSARDCVGLVMFWVKFKDSKRSLYWRSMLLMWGLLSERQMFMSPVTGSKPSHDVITVDNKSSNLSSHTFVNSADQELAFLVLPRKLTSQVFEFSFQVLDISSSLKLDTFLNIGTHPPPLHTSWLRYVVA